MSISGLEVVKPNKNQKYNKKKIQIIVSEIMTALMALKI